MGNFSSNQLIKNQDLSVSLVEKETILADNLQTVTDTQLNKESPQAQGNLETKKSIKKGKKTKLDDVVLSQKDLLPEQFSSLEELQKKYLEEKDKKSKSFIESSECELTVDEVEEITCLKITNDNKYLISGTQTGLITVYDLESKKPVHHLSDSWNYKINSINVSEDNEYVIAATDCHLILFNLNTKKEIFRIHKEGGAGFSSVLISKDKKHAITGRHNGLIQIFDLSTQEEIHHLDPIDQKSRIHSMAFSKDNLYFVAGSGDGSVRIFDFNTRNEIYCFSSVHKGAIYSVTISHDDKYIITGSADHSIKVFSLKTKEELYHFEEAHEDAITSIVMSKDNRYIYSASEDLSIKIFDLETKQEISKLQEIHKMQITSIALSNNQRYLLSGSLDGSIMMYDLNTQQKVFLEDVPQKDCVVSVEISNDNKYIISASYDGYIKVFDLHLKKENPQLLRCGERIWSIKIFPKNKFVMADCDNSIQIFDIKSMKKTGEIKQNKEQFYLSALVSSDERFLLFETENNSIKIADAITFQEVREISYESKIYRIDLSNDMKYLVCSTGQTIDISDFETENKIINLSRAARQIQISQDSKYLNVFCYTDEFLVFDLQAKQILYSFILTNRFNSSKAPYFLNITRDNKYIIGFSRSKEVKIWGLDTKQELDCYQHFSGGDNKSLFLSSDNQYIISGSRTGEIKMRRINLKKTGYELTTVPKEISISHVSILEEPGRIVLAFASGLIKMFDLNTKEEIDHFDLGAEILRFALSSNQSTIIFAVAISGKIQLFDFNKKEEEFCLNIPKKTSKKLFGIVSIRIDTVSVDISKDSKFFAAETNGLIRLFDIETKKEKWNLEFPEQCSVMTISNDDKYLFCASYEGSIYSYDLQTGKLFDCFKKAQDGPIYNLEVSRNNKYFILYSDFVKILEKETKQEIYNAQNVNYFCPTDALSHDDKIFILIDSTNKKLRVYDIHTMNELREFTLTAQSCQIAISKDNKTIINDASVYQACLDEVIYGISFFSLSISFKVSPKISRTSIFGGYDNFITSSWPKDVETQKALLLCHIDMYVYPHSWTLLHLLAIFRPSAISLISDYAQYPVDFLLDSYDKTPLHYLFAQKNRDYTIINKTFKYMIDYLEDKGTKAYQRQRVCSSLSQCFFVILSRASPSLIQRYLKICYPETPLQSNQVLPSFGSSEQKYTYSQLPVIDSQVFQKLYQEGDDRIVFRTNLIRLDYDPRSNDMFNAIHVLDENEQEIIFKSQIIENLINHLWETTKITMYITASTFSLLMITLSIYIASGEKSIHLEIITTVLAVLFLILEAFQGMGLGMQYFRSVWNWVDILQLLLTLVYMFNKLVSHQEIFGEAWIVLIMIITGYLRWLSYLRLFTSTRILIEIILAVLFDMLGFITVIAAILIGFSLIFLEFSRYQAISQDYGYHFYNAFKLLFGNYDDTGYDLSQTILVSFLLCVLNVVLLNLLIAIIGDSYGKVQEGRDLIDAKTRLEMIQEAVILMRKIKPKTTSEKTYLIYQLPEMLEERDLEDREWEERVCRIEKSLSGQVEIIKDKVEQKVNQLKENLGEQVGKIQNDIKKEAEITKGNVEQITRKEVEIIKDKIEQKVDQLEERLKENLVEQVGKMQNDTKKEIEIIKENVEQINKTTNELKENVGEQVGKMQNEIQGLKELVNALLTDLNEAMKTMKAGSSKE